MHRIIYRPDSTWFFLVDVVKLALGIFLGGAMLFFGHEALLSHRLEVASANAVLSPAPQSVSPARPVQPSSPSLSDRGSRSR